MRTLRYAWEEAVTSLARGRWTLLLSVATIAVTFAMLGAFRVVSGTVAQVAGTWAEAAEVSVYLDDVVTDAERTAIRQVALFESGPGSGHAATELMKQAIDSARGRAIYSQRIATVEPVFANIRHTKRLDRFTLRGVEKVGTQWRLYCLVHNIEKLAHSAPRSG